MFYFYLNEKPDRLPLINSNLKIKLLMGNNILESDFCKRVIREIDKSEVYNSNIIDSPFLGIISYDRISGGAATLILLYISNLYYTRLSKMGPNCSKILYEIAKEKDVHLILDYHMDFQDLELEDRFDAICVDTGEEVHTYGDFKYISWDWLDLKYPCEDEDCDPPIIIRGGTLNLGGEHG